MVFKFGLRDSFLNSHLPEVLKAANITTYLHANVISIETDEAAQKVTRLHVASLSGTRFSVSARLVILATGGIETPRLLLNSNGQSESRVGQPT